MTAKACPLCGEAATVISMDRIRSHYCEQAGQTIKWKGGLYVVGNLNVTQSRRWLLGQLTQRAQHEDSPA